MFYFFQAPVVRPRSGTSVSIRVTVMECVIHGRVNVRTRTHSVRHISTDLIARAVSSNLYIYFRQTYQECLKMTV